MVLAVLVRDALVHPGVHTLDRPTIDVLRIPEPPVLVETLEESSGVAPRVRDGQPQPKWRHIREEPLGHLPDRIRNTRGLVELHHHADLAVGPGEGVGVLCGPRLRLDVVILRVHLQLRLDEIGEPSCRAHGHGGLLEPVAVDGHGVPLAELRHRPRSKLRLGVGRHDRGAPDPARLHPEVEHREPCALADPPARRQGHVQGRRG